MSESKYLGRSKLYELEPIISKIPEIKAPKQQLTFQKKIGITLGALALFLILTRIPLYGASQQATSIFGQLQYLFASQTGTLMELGIGPIITAGVILQLFVGSKIIGLNLSDHEDRTIFKGTWKLLAILVGLFEGSMLVLANRYGVGLDTPAGLFILVQVVLGTIIIIYLDEIVSKYGFGNGIGLFIVGGVAMSFFWQSLNPTTGVIPTFVGNVMGGTSFVDAFFSAGFANMMGVVITVFIFLVVVYLERVRVEIPITYDKIGEIKGKCFIKLLYTSNIPVILVMTVFANLRIVSAITGANWLAYYTSAPQNLAQAAADPTHTLVYIVAFMGLVLGFAWFWMRATGMGTRYLPEQFTRLGISPLGSKSGPEASNQVSAQQTTAFVLLGAVLVGGLVAFAGTTGALVGGASMVLTIGILYQLYQEIVSERIGNANVKQKDETRFEKVCPVCGSSALLYSGTFSGWAFPGVHAGQSYVCKNCEYAGSIVLELGERDVKKLKQRYSQEAINGAEYSQPIFPDKWLWFWRIIALVVIGGFLLPILLILF